MLNKNILAQPSFQSFRLYKVKNMASVPVSLNSDFQTNSDKSASDKPHDALGGLQ